MAPQRFKPEEWKDITGYSGVYQVSTHGRVKSFKRAKGQILAPSLSGRKEAQYFKVSLHPGGKPCLIHRLVAMMFIPNPSNKPHINHKDGDKLNNHVSNLEWCTEKENHTHAMDMGLIPLGEKHGNSKLRRADVIAIKHRIKTGESGYSIGKDYAVHYTTVNAIQSGKTWKHVTI